MATAGSKPIGGRGFHHVAMRVADFDKSVGFYRDALGFREALAWGEGDKRAIMLDMGDGSCLELFAGGKGGEKPPGTLLHFALRTNDVDAAIARVRKAGAEVTMEPRNVDIPSTPPSPVRIAFFKGPDGELVEFFQVRATPAVAGGQ